MKFFKDLFNKDNEEAVKQATAAEQEAKRQERKERKKQAEAKTTTTKPVKYKKVNKTPLRENKAEDFENKREDHTVTKATDTEVKVEWKKPKEKKVFKKEVKEEQSFEELFGVEVKDVQIGDTANAEVLAISREGYIVAIDGTFVEATMPTSEFNGELSVGDKVEVVIYRLYDGIYYASNRRLDTIAMINKIAEAMDKDEVVSATVVGFNRNFFDVKINDKIDGQVYAGNIDTKFVNEENAQDYVGKTYDFAITKKLNSKKYKFELSRVKLIKLAEQQVVDSITIGEEITASNFTTNKGGVEFDYKGIRGFVPLAEVSNNYVNGIDDIPNHLDLNAETQVQVIDIKKQRGNTQLLCSIKSLQPSPWNNFIEKYDAETVLEAEIVEIRPYGFMVMLDCDIKTLLHKNNMSTEMGAEIKNYNVGDKFDVKIEEIDFDNNRVNITTSL
ncbi:S1 RNA-binding domain-containing protein [Mollicutes bacterium LVI A0078]|nr:S1 RNA-binding domain-containing protein [Mollicutes bacterium LVI A0075]WOO91087.1 S1 RNA-binding domain-containing protein [Mollicutes bacterium LVI A0078]